MHSSMHLEKITVGPADLREDWKRARCEEGVVIRRMVAASLTDASGTESKDI